LQVDPVKGTVAFGSGKHQWGFTLRHFARLYAGQNPGTDEAYWLEKLW
jgi:elongation factor 2